MPLGKETMKACRINESDIASLKISSLSSRPTAPRSEGGNGMSSKAMRAAFDRLPLYIIEMFNRLIDDITDTGRDSLTHSMPTGIAEGHTVGKFFDELATGTACTYISILGKTLSEHISEIYERLERLEDKEDKPNEN